MTEIMKIGLLGDIPVIIESELYSTTVRSIGRENIGQEWKGGVGYVPVKVNCFPPNRITFRMEIPDDFYKLTEWVDSIKATDEADNINTTWSKESIETMYRDLFIEYIRDHAPVTA